MDHSEFITISHPHHLRFIIIGAYITKTVAVNFLRRYHGIQHIGKIKKQFTLAFLDGLFHTKVKPKPHRALEKAVDLYYRPQPFLNETKRIEYLFALFDQYTAGLFKTEKKKK